MKENINNNFEKLIPKKAVIEPSFENSLLAFKYSSIAKKEQKEKTKILEAEKNSSSQTRFFPKERIIVISI